MIIEDVEPTKNILTLKRDVFANKASQISTVNARNAQMAQILHPTAKDVHAGITKFMIKFQIVAKIVVPKINYGSTTNVNVLLDSHGGVRNVEDVQIMPINLQTNQLVSAGVGLLHTILKLINVWNVGPIMKSIRISVFVKMGLLKSMEPVLLLQLTARRMRNLTLRPENVIVSKNMCETGTELASQDVQVIRYGKMEFVLHNAVLIKFSM